RWPCYYGIDTPTRSELIAASHTPEQIARYLTADSLVYLPLERLLEAAGAVTGRGPDTFCHACFSGDYAVPFVAAPPHAGRHLPLLPEA
ncbi:MAG: hypothetical protein EOO75_15460, partial [Myxococcales bacterium]